MSGIGRSTGAGRDSVLFDDLGREVEVPVSGSLNLMVVGGLNAVRPTPEQLAARFVGRMISQMRLELRALQAGGLDERGVADVLGNLNARIRELVPGVVADGVGHSPGMVEAGDPM